jgi:hypothetical protein
MRRGSLFFGSMLILAGTIFLLDSLDVINVNVWRLLFPGFLIAAGLWTLLGLIGRKGRVETEAVSIPLEGAERARIKLQHGAGRLRVSSGADADNVMSGTFDGGLDYQAHKSGDNLEVDMRVPHGVFDFFPSGRGLNWSVKLNSNIELSLDVEGGANEARLDLTDLKVTEIVMKTGASATEITMPANAGHTEAKIESGLGSMKIRFPMGVAGKIRTEGGLASISVDSSRFPRSGSVYMSADYDEAENKVELSVKTGLGSVEIE